ncbi:MAG: histidinol-phosphate transaminase [Candidatus Alkanophagales archaeon]
MFRPVIGLVEPYDAGVFPEDVARKYGVPKERVVNVASNELPYPPPEAVVAAVSRAAATANRYPKPDYQELKESISEYVGVPPENIAVGCGASELIDVVCKVFLEAFDKVVVPVPSYSMYVFFAMLRDASVELLETEGCDFELRAEDVIRRGEGAKLLFLPSPNNPTGFQMRRSDILSVAEALPSSMIVVDEAYVEFGDLRESVAEDAAGLDNLVVLRSFSKFFGLAGLRVGYAVASKGVAATLEKVRLPFCISGVAAAAAKAALENLEHYRKVREEVIEGRAFLEAELRESGFKVFPSAANFLLARLPEGVGAKTLTEALLRAGVIVRDVSGVLGLSREYLRVTVGTAEENRRVCECIKACLKNRGHDADGRLLP